MQPDKRSEKLIATVRSRCNKALYAKLLEYAEHLANPDDDSFTQTILVEYRTDPFYAKSRKYDCSPRTKWIVVTTSDDKVWHIDYEYFNNTTAEGFCCDEASELNADEDNDFDHLTIEQVVSYFESYMGDLPSDAQQDADENPAVTLFERLMMGDKFEHPDYPNTVFMRMQDISESHRSKNYFNAVVVFTKQRADDMNLGLGDVRCFPGDSAVERWS